MTAHFALADVAALLGEPTRAAMLMALLDGRALPATELARVAQLSSPATSLHLSKLVRGGLLAVRPEGRHRYYRIANADVGHAVEALGAIATAPPPARAISPAKQALRAARTCYDHLAGVVAVSFAGELERADVLRAKDEYAYEITRGGETWFADTMDIDVASLARGRRPLARRCLDWTERRPHIAGALGAAVLGRFLERGWIARERGSRAVRVTSRGEAALRGLGVRAS